VQNPDVRTISEAFARLMKLGQRARSRGKSFGGVDQNGYVIMKYIVTTGACRASEISEAAAMDPSIVTRQVHQLIDAQLLERFADPVDGRASLLRSTPAGMEFFDAHRCAKDAFYANVFHDWHDKDISTLATLLNRLNNDIESALNLEEPQDSQSLHQEN